MKTFSFGTEFGGFGILGGLGIIGFLGYQAYKLYKVTKKLDTTIDDLAKKESVEIQQDIVTKAVNDAVDRKVCLAVSDMSSRVGDKIRQDMDNEIRKDVKAHYDELKAQVSDKIAEDVASIDIDSLRKTVTNKAEKRIMDKFDGSLDGITEKLNRNLNNVLGIYGGIANTIAAGKSNNDNRGVRFTLD